MIIKEYACGAGHDFEGCNPVCPICGAIGKRAYRTAPGITTGRVGRTDKILEREFKARGITNFTNANGYPKVSRGDAVGQDNGVVAGFVDPRSPGSSPFMKSATEQYGAIPIPGGFESGQTTSTGNKATPRFETDIKLPTLREKTEVVTNAKGQRLDDNYGK
jgi:hypothetical protein